MRKALWAFVLAVPWVVAAQGFMEEEGPLPPPPPPMHPITPPPAMQPMQPMMPAPGGMMVKWQGAMPPFALFLYPHAVSAETIGTLCAQQGMHPATIRNRDELAKVVALLRSVPSFMWPPAVWHGAWIGLRQVGASWRWWDGTPLTLHAFGAATGEPRGDGPYVAVELARAGNPDGWWNDAPASEAYAAVLCERR